MFGRYILLLCRDNIYKILKECLLRNKNIYQILKGIMFLYSSINFDRRSSLLMGLILIFTLKNREIQQPNPLPDSIDFLSIHGMYSPLPNPRRRIAASRPTLHRASLIVRPIEGQDAAWLPCPASIYSRGST